jgi:antitoxin YefM
MMMQTISAAAAQSDFLKLLKSAAKGHHQYRIASDEGGAILLSEEEYESMVETLELLSTPGFYESVKQADKQIAEGETYSLDEVFGSE